VSAGWYRGLAVLFSYCVALGMHAHAKTAMETPFGALRIPFECKRPPGR